MSPQQAKRQSISLSSRWARLLATGLFMVAGGACAPADGPEGDIEGYSEAYTTGPVHALPRLYATMHPRAALGERAYHIEDGYETYGDYAHPQKFTVDLGAEDVDAVPGYDMYQWSIESTGAQKPYLARTAWYGFPQSSTIDVVEQGPYLVKLWKKKASSSAEIMWSTSMEVRDIVIVAVGDSMSSGEGDPTRWQRMRRAYALPTGIGGDLGTPVPFGPEFQYGDPLPAPVAGKDYPAGGVIVENVVTQPALWTDLPCHRSYNSGTARAVIEFEKRNPQLSVTFLDYACSGAKTYNLWRQAQKDDGGRKYTQLANLKHDLLDTRVGAYRKVEHLITSIGINNISFSDIMVNCLNPVHGGCDGDEDEAEMARRFATLDIEYDALDAAIQAQLPGLVGKVDLIDYPATNVFENEQGHLEACGILDSWSLIIPTNLNRPEMHWLVGVGKRLRNMGRQNAQALEWNYLDGIDDAFDARGYCAPFGQRYYNQWSETHFKQGDKQGLVHPNQLGYAAMGQIIADALQRTTPVPQPVLRDLDRMSDGFGGNTGWSAPQYYSTIKYPDVNGDGKADVCGRGVYGVSCALTNGTGFDAPTLWTTAFADADGWDHEEYYATLGFPDLDGDHKADVCGRGVNGMLCALSTGGAFGPVVSSGYAFTDANGWNQIQYASSFQYQDVNSDGRDDVCALGKLGIYCATSNGGAWLPRDYPWHTAETVGSYIGYSQFEGIANAGKAYYTNIRFPDVNGDGTHDVCGHLFYNDNGAGRGIFCAVSDGSKFTNDTFFNHEPGFETSVWFTDPAYYSTIEYPDVNGDGKADVCAHEPPSQGGRGGIVCALSDGHTFEKVRTWTKEFGADSGWSSDPNYYDTIRFADINGDGKADVCGRGVYGVLCGVSDGIAFVDFQLYPMLGDSGGFNHVEYSSTLAFADIFGDHHERLCIRGYYGLLCSK